MSYLVFPSISYTRQQQTPSARNPLQFRRHAQCAEHIAQQRAAGSHQRAGSHFFVIVQNQHAFRHPREFGLPHISLFLEFFGLEKALQGAETAREIVQTATHHKFPLQTADARRLGEKRGEMVR